VSDLRSLRSCVPRSFSACWLSICGFAARSGLGRTRFLLGAATGRTADAGNQLSRHLPARAQLLSQLMPSCRLRNKDKRRLSYHILIHSVPGDQCLSPCALQCRLTVLNTLGVNNNVVPVINMTEKFMTDVGETWWALRINVGKSSDSLLIGLQLLSPLRGTSAS